MSKYVRARDIKKYNGICPLCQIRKIEVNFHFLPRGNLSIRFDLANTVGACRGCNRFEQMKRGTKDALRFEEWFILNRGYEEWERLNDKKYDQVKFDREGYRTMIDFFKSKLKQL